MEVESKPSWPDEMQAYAAGIAEGYLTKDLIYNHWRNTIEVRVLFMQSLNISFRFFKEHAIHANNQLFVLFSAILLNQTEDMRVH